MNERNVRVCLHETNSVSGGSLAEVRRRLGDVTFSYESEEHTWHRLGIKNRDGPP